MLLLSKRTSIQANLVQHLSKLISIPTTCAGGVHSIKELESFYHLTGGKLDITIGISLDLFGGE